MLILALWLNLLGASRVCAGLHVLIDVVFNAVVTARMHMCDI
jgi:hypothetical protein